MTEGRKHARNALALLASGVGSKVVGFITAALVFKGISVAENGLFWLAWGLGFILAVITEMGLRGYLVRELARVRDLPGSAQPLVATVMNARLVLTATLGPLVFVVFAISYRDPHILWLTAGMCAYWLIDSYAMLLKAGLRAYGYMGWDAILSFAGRGLLLALVAVLFSSGKLTVAGVVAAGLVSAAAELAGAAMVWKGTLPIRLWGMSSVRAIRAVVTTAAPFAVLGIIGVLYLRTGTVALSRLAGGEAVAQFGAATRIPEALLFAPIALVNAIIPFLSRHHDDTARVGRYYDFLVRYLGSAAVAIAVAVWFSPEPLVLLVATREYLPAAPAFQWAGLWLIFAFLHHATANTLIALNHERWVMQRYLLALALNILFNAVLAPRYGAAGAAMALCLSECAGLALDTVRLWGLGVRVSPKSAGFMTAAGVATGVGLLVPWAHSELGRMIWAGLLVCATGAAMAWAADREALRALRSNAGTGVSGNSPGTDGRADME